MAHGTQESNLKLNAHLVFRHLILPFQNVQQARGATGGVSARAAAPPRPGPCWAPFSGLRTSLPGQGDDVRGALAHHLGDVHGAVDPAGDGDGPEHGLGLQLGTHTHGHRREAGRGQPSPTPSSPSQSPSTSLK